MEDVKDIAKNITKNIVNEIISQPPEVILKNKNTIINKVLNELPYGNKEYLRQILSQEIEKVIKERNKILSDINVTFPEGFKITFEESAKESFLAILKKGAARLGKEFIKTLYLFLQKLENFKEILKKDFIPLLEKIIEDYLKKQKEKTPNDKLYEVEEFKLKDIIKEIFLREILLKKNPLILAEGIRTVVDEIVEEVKKAVKEVVKSVSEAFQMVKNTIKKFVSKAKQMVGKVVKIFFPLF
jgi:hypothetical protein